MNKCNYHDCFSCPYPDCILGNETPQKRLNAEETKKNRKEYLRQYYLKHKEEINHKRMLKRMEGKV